MEIMLKKKPEAMNKAMVKQQIFENQSKINWKKFELGAQNVKL